MQILSSRWSLTFGAFTLGATLKAAALESAIQASATAFAVPAHPDGEVKLSAPCALLDPNGPVTTDHMLDGAGDTWVAFGTRQLSNTPNPSVVEAQFRKRAVEEFGEAWDTMKKKRLNGLRRSVKRALAESTPFRLSESGAVFICLQTGQVVCLGHAGTMVCKDLVGRIDALSHIAFTASDPLNSSRLLTILKRQEDSIIPWPTGTASLFRKRDGSNETCSVKMLKWTENSMDAVDLLHQHWKPRQIEVQWDDRKGTINLTGVLASAKWSGNLTDPDPRPFIEIRLAKLMEMNAAVSRLVAEASGTPLPMDA